MIVSDTVRNIIISFVLTAIAVVTVHGLLG